MLQKYGSYGVYKALEKVPKELLYSVEIFWRTGDKSILVLDEPYFRLLQKNLG